jgi:hypothetical protein
MNSLQIKQSSLIYMSRKQYCVASCKKKYLHVNPSLARQMTSHRRLGMRQVLSMYFWPQLLARECNPQKDLRRMKYVTWGNFLNWKQMKHRHLVHSWLFHRVFLFWYFEINGHIRRNTQTRQAGLILTQGNITASRIKYTPQWRWIR